MFVREGCGDRRERPHEIQSKGIPPRHFSFNAHETHRRPRMRAGWTKGSLLVFAVATALLYLGSIKREVHIHSERLQRAHHNDSIMGQGMLKRMAKMEADISRLRESKSQSEQLDLSVFSKLKEILINPFGKKINLG